MTATRCFVTMPRDWDTTIGHRLVAFLNHIRLHVRVLRARHVIALAGYVSAIKKHGRRARDDLAMMVGNRRKDLHWPTPCLSLAIHSEIEDADQRFLLRLPVVGVGQVFRATRFSVRSGTFWAALSDHSSLGERRHPNRWWPRPAVCLVSICCPGAP
jgi:hypothetical protein